MQNPYKYSKHLFAFLIITMTFDVKAEKLIEANSHVLTIDNEPQIININKTGN